jgi:hypothetical protein
MTVRNKIGLLHILCDFILDTFVTFERHKHSIARSTIKNGEDHVLRRSTERSLEKIMMICGKSWGAYDDLGRFGIC